MSKLRFAVFGAGFWSGFQIPGWLESSDVELVAICDKDLSKARAAADKYGAKHYDNAEEMLSKESLDFVDIITDVDTHLKFAKLGASYGLNVVCQKPLAPSYEDAKQLVASCKKHNVNLFVNENFRWQSQIRRVKALMDSGAIGDVFKGRVTFCSAFPVFDNQPFLKELDRFILTDIGSHILDICRFLFGEADTLYCLTKRVNPEINGEDVANVLMDMKNDIHCYAEMSYASILEKESFPQSLLLIEGSKGSIQLTHGFEIKVTTKECTSTEKISFKMYDWADPDYAVIHSSIVDTQLNLIEGLKGNRAETTGDDNFETVKLVWASYASAEQGKLIKLDEF